MAGRPVLIGTPAKVTRREHAANRARLEQASAKMSPWRLSVMAKFAEFLVDLDRKDARNKRDRARRAAAKTVSVAGLGAGDRQMVRGMVRSIRTAPPLPPKRARKGGAR